MKDKRNDNRKTGEKLLITQNARKSENAKARKEEAVTFSNYIKELRQYRDISMEKLCDGICTHQMVTMLEQGERVPDSLLQDALLERLGVGAENLEVYLDVTDYDRWEVRMDIISGIVYEDWDKAEESLERYRGIYGEKKKLERQFILSMLGQIRQARGASVEELREIYEEAVSLTISDVKKKKREKALDDRCLSLKELNLLLEAERYREGGARPEQYLDIMAYVEKYFDRIGVAKLYPKAVYLLCECKGLRPAKDMLRYCDKALEYLRDASRAYHLWEILELRDKLIKKRLHALHKENSKNRDNLQEALEINGRWKWALEKVYDRFHVRKETFEFCYLYVLKGTCCINDIVRIRREMLGMDRETLWGDYGDLKTLKRIEDRKTAPQRATVMILFPQLGLSTEYAKTSIETASPKVKQQMEMLKWYINSLQWQDAEGLLEEVKGQVSLENKYNRQEIMYIDTCIKWKQKQIDKEEYSRRMWEALEITLAFEAFLCEGEKYLTYTEQQCIRGIMQGLDKESEVFVTCMRRLEEYYEPYVKKGLLQSVEGMHSVIMDYVASEWGNKGEYEHSDSLSKVIIDGCLRFRKPGLLPRSLYNLLWNDMERQKAGIPNEEVLDVVEELETIIQLSNLDKRYVREKFYRRKLQQVSEKRG